MKGKSFRKNCIVTVIISFVQYRSVCPSGIRMMHKFSIEDKAKFHPFLCRSINHCFWFIITLGHLKLSLGNTLFSSYSVSIDSGIQYPCSPNPSQVIFSLGKLIGEVTFRKNLRLQQIKTTLKDKILSLQSAIESHIGPRYNEQN